MESKVLRQLDFDLGDRRPEPVEVSFQSIIAKPRRLDALNLMIESAVFEDKRLSGELGIDAGQWSRIRNGSAYLPTEKYHELIYWCGNHALLTWDAHQLGLELRQTMDSKDQQIASLQHDLAEARKEKEIILNFVKQTAG